MNVFDFAETSPLLEYRNEAKRFREVFAERIHVDQPSHQTASRIHGSRVSSYLEREEYIFVRLSPIQDFDSSQDFAKLPNAALLRVVCGNEQHRRHGAVPPM